MVIKLYEYCTSRVKFREKYKTAGPLKRNLIKKNGKICYLCNNRFYRVSQLELEHLIPVEVGGHLFDEKNINLACKKCHLEKTRIDVMTINILKKSKIISGKHWIRSFYKIERVLEFFWEFRKIVSFIDKNQKLYDFGENNIDYIQVEQTSNRTSKQEGSLNENSS